MKSVYKIGGMPDRGHVWHGSDKVRLDGLVDVKAQFVPRGQSLGGAFFALGAAAYG